MNIPITFKYFSITSRIYKLELLPFKTCLAGYLSVNDTVLFEGIHKGFANL